jgi:predicted anti-sigma-YlaC factor YlaD
MAGHRDRDRGCARAREWASLRLDGELSELERLLLRRHLGRCADCHAFAETIEAATRAIRATPQERPSRSLEPDPPRARPRMRVRVVAAAGLATAAAALGVGVAALIDTGSEPVPTAPTEIADVPSAPDQIPDRPTTTTANV